MCFTDTEEEKNCKLELLTRFKIQIWFTVTYVAINILIKFISSSYIKQLQSVCSSNAVESTIPPLPYCHHYHHYNFDNIFHGLVDRCVLYILVPDNTIC